MFMLILKAIIAILVYLVWMYEGGTYQESIVLALIVFGVSIIRPIKHQSKEEREKRLEQLRKNREKMMELSQMRKMEKKMLEKESLKRQGKM